MVIAASFSDSIGSNFERVILGLLKTGERLWVSQNFASSSRVLKGLTGFILFFFIYFPFFFTLVSCRDNVCFVLRRGCKNNC